MENYLCFLTPCSNWLFTKASLWRCKETKRDNAGPPGQVTQRDLLPVLDLKGLKPIERSTGKYHVPGAWAFRWGIQSTFSEGVRG